MSPSAYADVPRFPVGRHALWLIAVWLGGAQTLGAQGIRTVTGVVRTTSDSVPVAGARVRVVGLQHRAESDQSGTFVLREVPAGALRLVLDRIGFATDTVLLPAGATAITVYLREQAVLVSPLLAVAASSARERFARIAQTSTATIDPLDIERTPTVAEPDVTRTVQMLPGTVTKNDFTVGLNVRGGENDQNLIRLDGVTVFNPFHIGGLFGTFDAGMVDGVEFLTGAFPAEYGGRLSSVLDVQLRNGGLENTGLRGGISPLASRVAVDGPVGGTGASYLVGVRRTYADAFADAFSDEVFRYHFLDGVAKVRVPTLAGGSLTATAFLGRDALDLEWVEAEPGTDGVDLEYEWSNRLAGVTLRQPLGSVTLLQHVGMSEYASALTLVPDLLSERNTVRQLAARSTLALTVAGHDVQVGAGVERLRVRYDHESTAIGDRLLNLDYDPTTWSAFLDDQWRPARWLLLRPGLRVEHVAGGAGFTGLSPRAAVKVFLTARVAVTGSAGRYYQAVHSIRDQELPVSFFDSWIGADDVTPVARSDQVVIGMETWLAPDVALSVEGYDKSYDHLAIRNRGDDPKVRGDEYLSGAGFSRGLDVLLRRYAGNPSGWIAYGFLRAEREADGVTYAPAHDRRHTLNVVIQATGPWRTEVALRWAYGSPLPYTGIVGQWLHRRYNSELHMWEWPEDEVLSADINGERFPYYSRLDLAFRWDLPVWGGRLSPYLNVLNVTNRRNVFLYTFDYSSVPATRSGYSQLPILPTIGLEFEF